MIGMIGALELTLKECGYAFEIGAGVKALLQSLSGK
jgi:aspartate aminotransferase-like enzyme